MNLNYSRFNSLIRRILYWTNDGIHGFPMYRLMKEIKLIYENPSKGEKIRRKYLKEILSFAADHATFYSKYKDKPLISFPVINKQILREHYKEFIVEKAFIPGQKGEIHIQKTSGSTGTPFEVYQDTKCRERRIATIKFGNKLISFSSFSNLMHLRAIKHYWNFDGNMKWNKKLCILYADNSNLTDEKILDLINSIDRYKIRYVRGYMTTIDIITNYMECHGISFNKEIMFISVGELLLESLRKRVLKMGCKIISQYGNEENGIFGQSEVNKNGSEIILNRANCYIEILKMDSDEPVGKDELGRIVVTDFTNHAMPLIRYDIGDLAMIGEISEDGILLSIKNLCGRKTDLIYKTNGSVIDFFNSIPSEIYNNVAIKQWQFVQKELKKYELILCANKEYFVDKNNLVNSLKKLLGQDADIAVNVVDEIPVLSSGKRKVVIQEYIK